jgi:hypothetical protein
LPSNIRLGRKDLPGPNTPDFSSVMPVTMMKGFYKITGWNQNSSETAKKDFVCTN